MDPFERQHSFIVRFWRETRASNQEAVCRGMVEHVNTQERRHFQSLSELITILSPHWGCIDTHTPTASGRRTTWLAMLIGRWR